MSRAGDIELDFAGETRRFRIAIGEIRKIQEKCDAGPGEIAQRLAPFLAYAAARAEARARGVEPPSLMAALMTSGVGNWRVDDVREPILQGLIGAGMEPGPATRLVRGWVEERPLAESIPIAFAVMMAAIAGAEDEQPAGEPQGEAGASRPSPAASSASA